MIMNKIALLLILGWYMSQHRFWPWFVFAGVCLFALMLQKDLGTALIKSTLGAGEWADESLTELVDYSCVGLCSDRQSIDPNERETVTFRVSYMNALAALDNFYILLPEK